MNRGHRPRFWVTLDASMRLPNMGRASEFANVLGVSRKTLSTWIHKEGLPSYRVKAEIGCGNSFESYNYLVERIGFLLWAIETGRFDGPIGLNYMDQLLNGIINEIPSQRSKRRR